MTRVSFGVVLLLSALVIGCQDSNRNNPISGNSSSVPSMSKSHDNPDGVIVLNELVGKSETPEVAEFFQLAGELRYTLISEGGKGDYTLSTVFGGNMISLSDGKVSGRVDGEAIEQVFIEQNGSIEITNSYAVRGMDKPIRLYVTLSVSPDGVKFLSAWFDDDAKGSYGLSK